MSNPFPQRDVARLPMVCPDLVPVMLDSGGVCSRHGRWRLFLTRGRHGSAGRGSDGSTYGARQILGRKTSGHMGECRQR
jgi:hypothetical protein